jgi:hypothetical protein
MELYNFRWVVYCQMKNKSNNIDLMSIESMFLNSNFMYWKRFYDTFLISPKSKYFENLSNDLKMIHENNLLLLYDCTDRFTNQRNVHSHHKNRRFFFWVGFTGLIFIVFNSFRISTIFGNP